MSASQTHPTTTALEVPQIFGGETAATRRPARSLGQAMLRGMRCRCPNCGEGKLFRAFVKPVAACSVCGEDFTPQRADDLPAYITIIVVGHIVIPGTMVLEAMTSLSLIVHLLLWAPLTILLSLGLLQPIKGATIGLQWALYMHGFGGSEEGDA